MNKYELARETLKIVLVVVLPLVLLYTAFSFVLWDWNPSGWGTIVRFFMVFLGVAVPALGVGLILDQRANAPKVNRK